MHWFSDLRHEKIKHRFKAIDSVSRNVETEVNFRIFYTQLFKQAKSDDNY
ncbi:hypothetical protein KCO_00495 [Pectobacterium brasiliense ICMP 19477]|nr:hypothetical protein KCO_00495 [Pectobacterium brasiliense ICMP 19477]